MAVFKDGSLYVRPGNPSSVYSLVVGPVSVTLRPQKQKHVSASYSYDLFADSVYAGVWVEVVQLHTLPVSVPFFDISGCLWRIDARLDSEIRATRTDGFSKWWRFSDLVRARVPSSLPVSCSAPCTPADYCVGGFCDMNGCFEKEVRNG